MKRTDVRDDCMGSALAERVANHIESSKLIRARHQVSVRVVRVRVVRVCMCVSLTKDSNNLSPQLRLALILPLLSL